MSKLLNLKSAIVFVLVLTLFAAQVSVAQSADQQGANKATSAAKPKPTDKGKANKQTQKHEGKAAKNEGINQGINFGKYDFEGLKAEAAKTGKFILIDCYTTWCGPCKQMSRTVLRDSAVGAFYNAAFVATDLDMEAGEGPAIGTQYNVKAYPTYLLLDAQGTLLHRGVGAMSVERFINLGKAALDPDKRLTTWQARFSAGERSVGFFSQYADLLHECGLPANAEYRSFTATIAPDSLSKKPYWKLYAKLGDLSLKAELAYVIANLKALKRIYGANAVEAKISGMYWQPLLKAYQVGGPKSPDFLKLDSAFRKTKITNADLIADGVIYSAVDIEADPMAYLKAVDMFYKKQPNQLDPWWLERANDLILKTDNKVALTKAYTWVDRAVEHLPDLFFAQYLNARYQLALGRKAAAQKSLVLAQKLAEPDSPDAELVRVLALRVKQAKK